MSTLTLRLRLHLKLTMFQLLWMKSRTRVLESDNAAEAYDDKIEDVIKIPDDKPGERSMNVPMTAGSSRHSQDQGARFLKVNQLGVWRTD